MLFFFQKDGLCDPWEPVREWNEELQYSRELPRTDANLFVNQHRMRLRNRIIKRQQHYETKGAPLSMIIGEDSNSLMDGGNGKLQSPRVSPLLSNSSLFEAEDAAIVRDRNLCKVSELALLLWTLHRVLPMLLFLFVPAVLTVEGSCRSRRHQHP